MLCLITQDVSGMSVLQRESGLLLLMGFVHAIKRGLRALFLECLLENQIPKRFLFGRNKSV